MSTNLHDQDFFRWTQQQAELIRQGRFAELDAEHLVEELDSMGARERRELMNRLALLLAHLLKWQAQPERRGNSWRLTIKVQRLEISELLNENPSFKPGLPERLTEAYEKAVLLAAREIGADESAFPRHSPFTLEQTLDGAYFPE